MDDNLKVWISIGLMSFFMLILFISTTNNSNEITGATTGYNWVVNNSAISWTLFFVILVITILVLLRVGYGTDKRRVR